MNPVGLTEDSLSEQPALEWFWELVYETAFGPDGYKLLASTKASSEVIS